MTMPNRAITAALAALLLLGLLSGCGQEAAPAAETPDTPEPTPTETAPQALHAEESGEAGLGLTDFDGTLIRFLQENGYGQENFLVSPLSFRAAMALAASGAEGETKEVLLRAMGFADERELEHWYASVADTVAAFAEELKAEQEEAERRGGAEAQKPDRAFSLANSVWRNADRPGAFREDFIRLAAERFGATAAERPAAELTGAVNDWVKEQTHGLIPTLAEDLSRYDAILANALYLRSCWWESFPEEDTAPGPFTTAEGQTVEMSFMHRTGRYRYFEDGDCQLLILPMHGGISAAFVLGDASKLRDKLEAADWEQVAVTLPKFELETALEKNELAAYLRERGADRALTDEADFSAMCEGTAWCIGEILQKSRLKLDEDGIEAAAVTAVMMRATAAAPQEPPQPKLFTADRPFTFYLYTDSGETPELLFFGQLLR